MKSITLSEAMELRSSIRSWSGCASGSGWLGAQHWIDGRRVGGETNHRQNDAPTGYEVRGDKSFTTPGSPTVEVGMMVRTVTSSGSWEFPTRSECVRVVVPDGWRPGKRPGKALRSFVRQARTRQEEEEAKEIMPKVIDSARWRGLDVRDWINRHLSPVADVTEQHRRVLRRVLAMI